jgi:hypothetical protein
VTLDDNLQIKLTWPYIFSVLIEHLIGWVYCRLVVMRFVMIPKISSGVIATPDVCLTPVSATESKTVLTAVTRKIAVIRGFRILRSLGDLSL